MFFHQIYTTVRKVKITCFKKN